MSSLLRYTDVTESELTAKAAWCGAKEFVRVESTTIVNQFPHPIGYKCPAYFMTKKFETMGDRIINFKVRPDDIWISTFPKTGTTWTMNIVRQLMNNIDLSNVFANEQHVPFETPFLSDINSETSRDIEYVKYVKYFDKRIDRIDRETSPRLLKSHLPAELLPKGIWTVKPKLINVHRDAKDVAISMYHMWRNHSKIRYEGSMDDIFDLFLTDHIVHGPFYAHVDSFKRLSEIDHVLLLSYKEMSANPFAAVKKISEFLNYSYSDDQLRQLAEHLSFDNMRKHFRVPSLFPSDYKFFRTGRAGGYHNDMSEEYIQKFDEWKRRHYEMENCKPLLMKSCL